jgi:dUTP pyrophosphatase
MNAESTDIAFHDLFVQYSDRATGELFRAHPGDAGLDLFCSEEATIAPGQFVDVPLGVSVEIPHGYWAMLTGRSSTLRKRGLLVNQGVIDQGYRGPLFAGCWNLTDETVVVPRGDRVAQLILLPLWTGNPVAVLHLNESSRGSSGFGSSGL